MTKEKAVSLLSQMFLIQFSKEEHEALAMAIDALNADCKTEPQTSKIIEAYTRGWADGADAVKAMSQTYVINPQEPTNDEKCFECDDFFTCGGQCNKIEDEPQKNYVLYDGCSRCGARDRCEDAYQSHSYLCNNYGIETPCWER